MNNSLLKKLTVLFIFFSIHLFFQPIHAADKPEVGDVNPAIDSLKSLVASESHDTTRVVAGNDLCWRLMFTDNQNAITYGKQAMLLAESINFEKGLAKSYNILGISDYVNGNYEEAKKYFYKSIEVKENLGDKKGISSCLMNVGNVYYNQGFFEKALDCYLKSLHNLNGLNEPKTTSNCYNNIGILYADQGNLEKAMDYYEKSLKIQLEHKNGKEISKSYNNIGNIYSDLKDYEKSIEYYKKALAINKKNGNERLVSGSYNNIGTIYFYQKDYNSSLEMYNKALEIRRSIEDKYGIAECLINIALLNNEIPDDKEAIIYAQKGLLLAKEIGATPLERYAYESLYVANKGLKNYHKALEFHEKFKIINDSLFSKESTKNIAKFQLQYDMAKEEAEQKEYLRISKEKESRRNNLQYFGILIGLSFLLFGIFLSGRYILSVRITEIAVFFVMVMLFEFILVFLDPYVDVYSEGIPLLKLAFNGALALLIFPLHSLLETRLKRNINT